MDSSLLRYHLILIPLLLMLVLGAVPVFGYITVPQFAAFVDREVFSINYTSKADWSTLEGKIVLSLRDKGSTDSISVYEHRIGRSKLVKLARDEGSYYGPRTSYDDTLVAFSVLTNGAGNHMHVASSDPDDTEFIQLSKNDTTIARLPSWSFDGDHLAFMARRDAAGDTLDVSSWEIQVADVAVPESARYVTTGAHPIFLADGSILVLKSDGLYRYLEVVGVWHGERIVEVVNGAAFANMHLALSRDGTKLAWSNFEAGTLDIYIVKIDSDTKGVAIIKDDELPVYGFWPVFSPDGKYVALEEVESASAPLDQKLVAFDLSSGEKIFMTDLSPYEQDSLFITEWRTPE